MEQSDFNTTQMDSRERLRTLNLRPGDVIAENYEFVRELARDDMGAVVCLCHDKKANDLLVVVKTIPDILYNNEEAVSALTREYDKINKLTSDGIVAVRLLLKDDFRYYVVMDYAEGETLAAYLLKHRRPALEVTHEVIKRLAIAIDYAHEKGMVHCDIKPRNVMVQIDGDDVKSVKLLDFGLGFQIRKNYNRITRKLTNGTSTNKSPEQWYPHFFGNPSFPSDQYSLAVIAYEMLSGDYPFSEYDNLETFRIAVKNDAPAKINGIEDYMNDALQKALSKKPENRYESCKMFVDALMQQPKNVNCAPRPGRVCMLLLHTEEWEDEESCKWVFDLNENDMSPVTLPLPGNVPLELVNIPPGVFIMGSPENERGRSDNETQHIVKLTNNFWLGKFPVTQEQYEAITQVKPSYFDRATFPVECVSWHDANKFCDLLNNRFGSHLYKNGFRSHGWLFTLPTEAQWEYACRAGTSTPFNFGSTLDNNMANCNFCYDGDKVENNGSTTDVGSYAPNTWGLYDMHGNVWEWCRDRYKEQLHGVVYNPTGALWSEERALRGGSWRDFASDCRSAYRSFHMSPSYIHDNIGFRVALVWVEKFMWFSLS